MRRMAIAAVLVALFALPALAQNRSQGTPTRVRGVVNKLDGQTLTPIQHLVVIFQENVSFDHYFGTYPTALNRRHRQPLSRAARAARADVRSSLAGRARMRRGSARSGSVSPSSR